MTLSRDRFSFAVDPDAPPSDWDVTLARFLLRYVRSRPSDSPAEDPTSNQATGATGEEH